MCVCVYELHEYEYLNINTHDFYGKSPDTCYIVYTGITLKSDLSV